MRPKVNVEVLPLGVTATVNISNIKLKLQLIFFTAKQAKLYIYINFINIIN